MSAREEVNESIWIAPSRSAGGAHVRRAGAPRFFAPNPMRKAPGAALRPRRVRAARVSAPRRAAGRRRWRGFLRDVPHADVSFAEGLFITLASSTAVHPAVPTRRLRLERRPGDADECLLVSPARA